MGIATQPKSERNQRIADLKEKGWSDIRIGKRLNISRQRVYQIRKKLSTAKFVKTIDKKA